MVLYNVTVTVDLQVSSDWVHWMKTVHIPDVMATGLFISYRFSRLLDHEHTDAEIYTAQYLVKDLETLKQYSTTFAPKLQADRKARFEGKYAAFRTVMEVIDQND